MDLAMVGLVRAGAARRPLRGGHRVDVGTTPPVDRVGACSCKPAAAPRNGSGGHAVEGKE